MNLFMCICILAYRNPHTPIKNFWKVQFWTSGDIHEIYRIHFLKYYLWKLCQFKSNYKIKPSSKVYFVYWVLEAKHLCIVFVATSNTFSLHTSFTLTSGISSDFSNNAPCSLSPPELDILMISAWFALLKVITEFTNIKLSLWTKFLLTSTPAYIVDFVLPLIYKSQRR